MGIISVSFTLITILCTAKKQKTHKTPNRNTCYAGQWKNGGCKILSDLQVVLIQYRLYDCQNLLNLHFTRLLLTDNSQSLQFTVRIQAAKALANLGQKGGANCSICWLPLSIRILLDNSDFNKQKLFKFYLFRLCQKWLVYCT